MALRLRRGTDAERQVIIPESGELIYTTDTKLVYVGDGVTTGGLAVSADAVVTELSEDTSPELGGDLDLSGFALTGTGDINITGDINATTVDGSFVNVDTLSSSSLANVRLGTDLDLNSNNIVGVGNINIDGVVTATGNINLGDDSGDLINVGGTVTSNLLPSTNLTYNIGAQSFRWNNGYFGSVSASTIVSPNAGTIYDDAVGTLTVDGVVTNAIYNDDSSTFYDGASSTLTAGTAIIGDIYNNVDELVYSSTTGTMFVDEIVADLRGSVFADDSSVFFDAINSRVVADSGYINTLGADDISSTTGLVTVGTQEPSRFEVFYDGSDSVVRLNTLAQQSSYIDFNVSRGTLDVPDVVLPADPTSGLRFRAYDGSNFTKTSIIASFADSGGVINPGQVSGTIAFINTNSTGTGNVIAEFDTFGTFQAPVLRPISNADTTARDAIPGIEAGAIVYVADAGTGNPKFQGYNGTTWENLSSEVEEVVSDSASFTLDLADAAQYHRVSNAGAVTVTVPTNANVAFPIGTNLTIIQAGAGQVSVAGEGGVTINSADSLLSTRVQYSAMTLVKVGTDEWDLTGDLA